MPLKGQLSLDFETYSECDLKLHGGYVYSEHPSTEIMCAYYRIGDNDPAGWHPYRGEDFPEEVIAHIFDRKDVRGWNFGFFERQIWANVLIPQVRRLTGQKVPALVIEQTHCTMTEALAMALPGKLEMCAKALKLPDEKDMSGNRVMLQLSKPRKARKNEDRSVVHRWTPEEAPKKFERLYDYCAHDVIVESEIADHVRRLSDFERKVYLIDQKINDRGICVDLPAVKAAKKIALAETALYEKEISKISKGMLSSSKQYPAIANWLRLHGVQTDSVASEVVDELLKGELPLQCRQVLTLMQKANKSSVAKLDAYIARTCFDGRMRGNFQMNGAGSTRRFAARGAQLQNLPRKGCKDPDQAIQDMIDGFDNLDFGLIWGDPMVNIAGCLRGMLIPDRAAEVMNVMDWSNIEGRLTAWLCGERWKVDAFRAFDAGTGPDLYRLAYSTSFNIPVDRITDDQRQIGKVQELALGFAGGEGAFLSMAENYGVRLPSAEVKRVIDGWRAAHPKVVLAWNYLEKTAFKAMRNPGKAFRVSDYMARSGEEPACFGIRYLYDGKHLWCQLPSGERLCYPFAEIEDVKKPWGTSKSITYWGVKKGQWMKQSAWRGIFIENIVQAIARELLVRALVRLEEAGYPVIIHVHDEIGCEGKHVKLEEMDRLMTILPEWCKGAPWGDLPIAAAGWVGHRYKKD